MTEKEYFAYLEAHKAGQRLEENTISGGQYNHICKNNFIEAVRDYLVACDLPTLASYFTYILSQEYDD